MYELSAEKDRGPDLSIEQAAVELGMSPDAVIRLLEGGQLPSHLGPDGRRRRIRALDVDKHRTDRFALRQKRVQEERSRHWGSQHGWADPELMDLDDLPA